MAASGSGDGEAAGAARQFALRHRILLLSLALAVLLLLGGLLLVRPRSAPPVHPGQETIDADRLEKALDDVDLLRQVGSAGGSKDSEAM